MLKQYAYILDQSTGNVFSFFFFQLYAKPPDTVTKHTTAIKAIRWTQLSIGHITLQIGLYSLLQKKHKKTQTLGNGRKGRNRLHFPLTVYWRDCSVHIYPFFFFFNVASTYRPKHITI